ncbi:MAG: acylphosphatase [Kiloniellaceae bacterium]
MTTTLRVVVSGRVQGVWFRAWTEKTAEGFGLSGWVRNRRDGTVEAVLSGEAAAVEAMIEKLWQGPPLAQVAAVDRYDHDGPVAPGFAVKESA